MIVNITLALLFGVELFCLVMFAKTEVTGRQRMRIVNAIWRYECERFDKGCWEKAEVNYNDMEPFDKTLFRLWDWDCKRILPPEKYEIIKPYLKGAEEM